MAEEVKVDLAYIEEVFESKNERIHFLMLVYAEFQEAAVLIKKAILEENLYTLRKTLHNVNTHLEMLDARQMLGFLHNVKDQVSAGPMQRDEKQALVNEVDTSFQALLRLLHADLQTNR